MTNPKPYRYRTALQSREPGYLAKRFKAYLRLQRMQAKREVEAVEAAAKSNVVHPMKRAGR